MKTQFFRRWLPQKRRWWLLAALLPVVVGLTIAGIYQAPIRKYIATAFAATSPTHTDDDGHDHAKEALDADGHGADGHDEAEHDHEKEANHAHAPGEAEHNEDGHIASKSPTHKHEEAAAIKLSKQAQGNIGLRLVQVDLRPFERTITVPGLVVERPGWSVLEVTAPMTGVVTQIFPIQGEAVKPGQPLFEVRLTHEDLLQVQTEFLRTVEELDVIGREVARLEKVSNDGVIAGKTLLERKYEQQKQEAALRAQRQALLLHGLSKEQVDEIVAKRTLLQSLTICAPVREKAGTSEIHPLQIQHLKVAQGKRVNAGDTLCTLVDYGELYIEGMAFEQDIQAVNRAAAAEKNVSAVLGSKSTADEETIQGLHILYLDDQVDLESRAFHFYVTLPNRVLRENKTPEGRNFIYWQFKSGQRTQVRISVEQWADRIVLPVEALAQDGAEAFVFEANDDHFDKRSVHVEYRDQDWAVIANDGALRIGATVAASSAHQMLLALKNKTGGGVDPHAGHNH